MFLRFDTNSDGKFSSEEMRSLLRVIDIDDEISDDAVMDVVLNALDQNNDGMIEIEEFLDWVMSYEEENSPRHIEEKLKRLKVGHVFVDPQDEANLERLTLWELRSEQNNRLLLNAGFNGLDDTSLLIVSVGSSSSQAYDAGGLAVSFPVGTKVTSPAAYEELTKTLRERGVQYSRVLLINSIGYQLNVNDPLLLALQLVAERAGLPAIHSMHSALQAALPDATLHVYNRAKDPVSKRYKFPQVTNDFSEALANERFLTMCKQEEVPDAIVDWGGGSFKVYVDGKRLGTEIMDANACLCDNDVLCHDRMAEAIREIKLFVVKLLPDARSILIAQTGKAREIAVREGLSSFPCS